MNNILSAFCYHSAIANALNRLSNVIGEKYNLSASEMLIIFTLFWSDKNTLTQKELEHITCFPQTVANELCRRVESKGYLYREKSEQDKRIRVVRLSDKGIDICNKLEKTYLKASKKLVPEENVKNLDTVVDFYRTSYDKVNEFLKNPKLLNEIVED